MEQNIFYFGRDGSDKYFQHGIIEIKVDNLQVKISDLEKSACDAVRFRNKLGIDITIKVLKNYVKRTDKNLNTLSKYAQQLRIEKIRQMMLMPLL